ncbi:MAG: hypothetical protein II972_02785 [Elusimicrobiaceae bacterium]|nr:hypothetical protein [Elusimicrobiaceae bacterium]MBQ6224251.1 hypothetical protein [Campylobacter sp.]
MKKLLSIIIAVGVFFFILSALRIQKEKSGQRIAVLMEDIAFKEARNQYIAYQVGIYTGPQAVIDKARGQGLVFSEPTKVIILEVRNEH